MIVFGRSNVSLPKNNKLLCLNLNKSDKGYLGDRMARLRVGVLMGGRTIEKEVSLNSGRTVCDHLDTTRYNVVPIFQTFEGLLYVMPWHFLHRGKTTDFEQRLATEAQLITWDELKNLIDFAYIAIHGTYAEDGTMQGVLEVLKIPYFGSKVLASALGMDKIMQKEFLKVAGVKVPRSIVVTPAQIQQFQACEQEISTKMGAQGIQFPCVVKPYKEGSSLGVSMVFTQDTFFEALHKAASVNPTTLQSVLVEERIEGMEFTCILISDYKTGKWIPLAPTEVVPVANTYIFDYEQKYMPGKAIKFTPARCTAEQTKKIQEECIRATEALGITNTSRLDGFLLADSSVVIIESNTFSSMAPTGPIFRSAAIAGIGHTQLINHLIETELHHYGMLDAVLEAEKSEEQSMEAKKIRVAVLMAGPSNEKEISLESGRNIAYKLSPKKYEVLSVFVSSKMELFIIPPALLVRHSTKEIEESLDPATKINWSTLPAIADFVFIGLHGGEGENGAVQGTLEMLGLPYNGSSVLTSALCMDKARACQFLRSKGFDVPNGILVGKEEWQGHKAQMRKKIFKATGAYPLIVKPHDDGCSVMVAKVTNEDELTKAVEAIFVNGKNHAMVEECIMGMELTIGVIGNENPKALPPSQVVASKGILSIEEKFLPGAGENQTPAQLPASAISFAQNIIEQAYKAVDCKGYARIDCFYQNAEQSPTGKERLVILEFNSLPAMTPATCIFHQAAEVGIKPMDFIDVIVALGFENHKNLATPTTAHAGFVKSVDTDLQMTIG